MLRVTYTMDGRTFQALIPGGRSPVHIKGTGAGQGGQSGLLGLDLKLAGTAAGVGDASGDLTVVGVGGDVFMAGTSVGLGAVAAALGIDLKLAGTAPRLASDATPIAPPMIVVPPV